MSDTIYIEKKDIPSTLLRAFPEYQGKKFEVRRTNKVTLSGAYWDGGTRSEYRAVNIDTGEVSPASPHLANPFTPGYKVPTVEIPPRVCIVEHCIFCGKDMGLRFHVNEEDTQKMLPPPVEMTKEEQICLYVTLTRKASYNGINRQQVSGLSLDTWNEAKASLIARGFLDKRGAATVNGRNARGSISKEIASRSFY